MIAEITGLFGSRLAPRRSRASVRRRRPAGGRIAIESLEGRRLLAVDPNLGWIKIDLSNLDQTGVTPAYDIYIQGSANKSGQILQYDPALQTPDGTGGLVFTTPLPSPVTFTSKNYAPVSGDAKSITLSTAAQLFVGGSVKFSDGSTSTITSISANVTAGSYAPPASSGTPGTWNPAPSGQWTVGSNVAIQSASTMPSGTVDGVKLSGANGPVVANSGMSIGSLVVGTILTPNQPNTYFFNKDGKGLPFPATGQVTQISSDSNTNVDATFSVNSEQSNLVLGSGYLSVFTGGTNSNGFATYVSAGNTVNELPQGTVQQITVGNLYSTTQVQPSDLSNFDPKSTTQLPNPKSFLTVEGVTGNFPVYGVDSYTITFKDPVPTNAAVTFGTTIAATATSATTFTIDASSTGIQGVIDGLSLGLQPTLSQTTQSTSALSISELALDTSTNTITVTLSGGNMPWSSGQMNVDLPPQGGFLPTTKWSATDAKSNTIWARQTTDGAISVNGSRIYFSLVIPGDQPPQMAFAQGGGGLTVTQFAPEDIWTGKVPPTQYMELTADSLSPGGDGQIYVDLSAVDGFFFPAALSTSVNGKKIVIGQASGTYVPPTTTTGPTTYSAVSRQEILNAYDTFFTNTTNTSAFASGASALQQAYAGLHIKNAGNSVGLMNPTFLDWSTPSSPAATVLNAAWDNDLNALFTTSSNQVDLLGDKNSAAWSVMNAIQVANQGNGYAVGDAITFTAPSSGGRAATAKVKQVQPSTANNPGGIVLVEITDPGVYPVGETPTVASIISVSGQNAALTVAAMVPAMTFYKGVPTAATGTASGSNPNKLVLTEYVGPSVITAGQYKPPANFVYANLYATGAVFTVFDPRTVPASETQAFNPGTNGGQPTPMAVGQQILGNFGVFASTATTSDNYTPAVTNPWSSGDALAQLNALQRDIVWALNQGNGGILRQGTQAQPGSTTAYWTNEANWYPYPFISQGGKYQAQTPQNLFAQWVHTAGSAGGPAIGPDKYFATFPFGNLAGSVPQQDYGQPTRAWGATGAGTGPLMNQTYGFAFDETPPHGIAGANVPSKFLAIPNTAGSTQTFQLVFGPWADPAPTVHSIATNPVQSGSTPTPAASRTLSWTVTFSEAVSGVTASNFTAVTGNTDASGNVALSSLKVSPSSGSAKTWTVTGTILGAGAGQTTLNLSSNAGITDSAGQALSTSTYGGETYTYAAPAVTSISPNKGSVNGGTSVTISGTGFNQLSTVKFGTVAATSVTYNPASGGSPATLTAVSPRAQSAGPVDVTVTWNGGITSVSSPATFTYVATSTPVVTASTAPLPADATTFTIFGEHFSPTTAGNTVKLSSGVAIVQSATATSITLLFTRRPTAGPLTATARTGGAWSGPVQVATVYATVTPATDPIAATAKRFVITGTGFDATTRANNVVTLSSGAGVVTNSTATALTILLTAPPQLGPLSVTSVSVRGVVSSGLPVQVATVVPGPASVNSTVAASTNEAAVGSVVTVTLQAVDAVGNAVSTGGARVRFTASSSGTFSQVTDNRDGTYTATFTTTRVGSQVFSATVNGVQVTDTATTAFIFQSQFSQPIPGPNWSVARGGFLALFNTAIATATKNNVALYSGAAARNVTVSANVGNLENGQFGGVVARYSSKTSYYQAGLMLESGQYYAVIQAVGVTGVRTLVKQSVVGVGEGLVSFTLNGNSLSLSLNGFQVAQVTDRRFQSGSVGISGGQSVGFTNFFAG